MDGLVLSHRFLGTGVVVMVLSCAADGVPMADEAFHAVPDEGPEAPWLSESPAAADTDATAAGREPASRPADDTWLCSRSGQGGRPLCKKLKYRPRSEAGTAPSDFDAAMQMLYQFQLEVMLRDWTRLSPETMEEKDWFDIEPIVGIGGFGPRVPAPLFCPDGMNGLGDVDPPDVREELNRLDSLKTQEVR